MNRDLHPPILDYPERIRIVPPMATVHRLADRRRVDLHALKAANDRAYVERERKASGGRFGVAVMVLVAVFIALLLATGGVL